MGTDEQTPRPPIEPIWLSLRAAYTLVSVSESSLRRLLKEGKVRSVKRGKSRLVQRDSLLSYFDQLPTNY